MSATEANTLPSSQSDDAGPVELRLDGLPRSVFVLPTHLSIQVLEKVEDLLASCGATTTNRISDASIVLASIASVRRAKFELNTRDVDAEIVFPLNQNGGQDTLGSSGGSHGKRKRDVDFPEEASLHDPFVDNLEIVKVVKLEWLYDSLKQSRPLTLDGYLVCAFKASQASQPVSNPAERHVTPKNVDKSNKTDGNGSKPGNQPQKTEYEGRTFHKARRSHEIKPRTTPSLVHETTVEHDEALNHKLPHVPNWVREGKVYACERVTPVDSPNSHFLDLLEKIRLSRILIEDQIGVRAYSTSIASLAAYPYKLTDAREIDQLPGCDQKIEALFREYRSTGQIASSRAVDEDSSLCVINDFYNIWGVGAKTAREWYFERGWREHDDIIQYGWNDLSRVQQIGLKYFDEFELKIPRAEVERIASVVHEHAQALTDTDLTYTIVGGYRRGKPESGDVDIILSHPDEAKTQFLINPLVVALEDSGWITHTLTLAETNSQREQQPLGLRMDSSKGGFDTLDKALVVWQDPAWPTKQADRAAGPTAKNPNVHRRVDIIISPWRTIGCAVAGWSSGTTFQRDLRRYAKHKYGWKFDSSGVRDRITGRWVDLEKWADPATRAATPIEAERRVFEGLGLEYREPWERCTR